MNISSQLWLNYLFNFNPECLMDTNGYSNDDMVAAFSNGQQEAIDYIFKTHYRPLCYFAQGLINSKEDAEDIVIDTFIKLLRKKKDFDTLINIKGFLYTATRHACFDFLKHIRRKTASHKEIIYLMEKDEDYIQSRIIEAELLKMILNEVEQLPTVRKKIFKLIFVEGLSNSEIAQRLGITVDTVRVQKARALEALRNVFLKTELLSISLLCLMKRLSDDSPVSF